MRNIIQVENDLTGVGFQKGINAQIKLTNRRIDEMIAELTTKEDK